MDLIAGAEGSADLVIAWGDLDDEDEATEAFAQAAWDAMCDHAREVRPEYRTNCPPAVMEWAKSVSMLFYRAREQGGSGGFVIGGEFQPGVAVTTAQIRSRRGILGAFADPARRVSVG